MANLFDDADMIFSYSRRQAIEDGVLVDISDMAKEAGVKFPTAVTRAVWDDYITPPENAPGQDVKGRLWDLLMVFRTAAKQTSGDILTFKMVLQNKPGKFTTVELKAVCGPGDDPEPVITIMQPEES